MINHYILKKILSDANSLLQLTNMLKQTFHKGLSDRPLNMSVYTNNIKHFLYLQHIQTYIIFIFNYYF